MSTSTSVPDLATLYGKGKKESPGLYVHIPFCRTKCPYCNFYSITDTSTVQNYIDALKGEMALYVDSTLTYDTIYVGGGTPSILTAEQLFEIFDTIMAVFSIAEGSEITIEANPGDIDGDFASFLVHSPVNRINVGVQSFSDDILAYLGRRHSAKKAISALDRLIDEGCANIGLDLIYGIPGQGIDLWKNTLAQALLFSPAHLSCYELTVEPETPLGMHLAQGDTPLPEEDEMYDFFMTTTDILKCAGYVHYEVSNFASTERFVSRHNRKYWSHTPYLGLGSAAHSFFGNMRWWNHRSVKRYIADAMNGRPPIESNETLDSDALIFEALFLGLRTAEGVDLYELNARFQVDLLKKNRSKINALYKNGFIEIERGRIRPTDRGLAIADYISTFL